MVEPDIISLTESRFESRFIVCKTYPFDFGTSRGGILAPKRCCRLTPIAWPRLSLARQLAAADKTTPDIEG
jgi:hypothetical protein